MQPGPRSQAFPTMITFSPFLAILYNFLFYSFFIIKPRLALRVLGLSIRDCAGSPNNFAPKCPKLSAIGVTAKSICGRLVGFRMAIGGQIQIQSHTPTSQPTAISQFPCFFCSIFFKDWPPAKCDLGPVLIWPTPGTLLALRKKEGAGWTYHCLQKKKRKKEEKNKPLSVHLFYFSFI